MTKFMCNNMKIQYSIWVLIAFLFASCSKQEEAEKHPVSYGKVNVTVSVTLPQPEPVNVTSRSYTDMDIKNVDVLVFDKDGKFMERVKVEGSQLTTTQSGVSFTVRLDATQEKRIIHLVTNGRTADGVTERLNFGSLSVNMLESTAMSTLQTASLENVNNGESTLLDNVMPLVMWGRLVLDGGINVVTTANGVKLLRAAACVQVKKGVANSNNGLNDFIIEGITVHRGACHGFLTPSDYTAVNTPATANPAGGNYLDYSKGWVYGAEPSLYIYERNCTAIDYMGVILKASYQGKMGYYKIVMTDNSETPLNIVRNHRYIITIVGVNGPGCEDVATAVTSAPSNALKVEFVDDDTDFSCIVADGHSRMASSNNLFNLYGKTSGTGTTTHADICTVYSSRGISPIQTLPAACTWLSNLSSQPLGNNKYRISGDFLSANISSAVATTLTLTCDNLSLPVEIVWNPIISTQKDADSYVLDLVDSTDENWNIQVLAPSSTNWLHLHPSASTPGGYPGPGMMSELSSKYYSHAYLHVGIGSNKQGALLKNAFSSGETIVGKIIIVQ